MYSVYVIDFKDATVEYDINLNLLIFCFVLIMRPVFFFRDVLLKYMNKKSEMCVQQISQIKTLITKCNNLDRFLKVKVLKERRNLTREFFLSAIFSSQCNKGGNLKLYNLFIYFDEISMKLLCKKNFEISNAFAFHSCFTTFEPARRADGAGVVRGQL